MAAPTRSLEWSSVNATATAAAPTSAMPLFHFLSTRRVTKDNAHLANFQEMNGNAGGKFFVPDEDVPQLWRLVIEHVGERNIVPHFEAALARASEIRERQRSDGPAATGVL